MATPLPAAKQHEGEYEDLLSLWSDLETALSLLLSKPLLIHDFPGKLRQLDVWLRDLVAHDNDAALYLMFQLAATSTASYSGKSPRRSSRKPFKITPCKARRCWRGCSSQTLCGWTWWGSAMHIFQTGYRWNRRHPPID